MSKLPVFTKVSDIQFGNHPALEAWLYHFLTENNIEYLLNPSIVSSPEQMRFMVALSDEQVYLPCGDELFFRILYADTSGLLSREYLKAWRFIIKLVHSYAMNKADTRRILGLCRYRFNRFYQERMVLPSRVIKRLVTIVLTQCGDHDPFRERKHMANAHAEEVLQDSKFLQELYRCPDFGDVCTEIPQLRREMDFTEMARLMVFSTLEILWQEEREGVDLAAEVASLEEYRSVLRTAFDLDGGIPKKILFIPDVAGGFMFDVVLIRSLLRQGHQVVLVLKDAFYFNSPTIWDAESDTSVRAALEDAHFCTQESITKNELLQLLREHRFVVISDGTTEQLNLYRTTVSFARAWKECDLIIAKGRRNMQILLGTSHQFTRDLLCYWRDDGDEGEFHLELKPRAGWIRKFAEKDLLLQARNITREMYMARKNGKTVMFYSAVIGSIPGQTKVAITVVNTFVAYLRDRMDNTLIINPAEHFEEGMDGDDLMYMWEHVQRSGFLDVWRFQTVEDIEISFNLMNRKVPSLWSGKDSTFSTGCTKEMRIALDEQRKHPELQIIGPAPEKFFRRRDYGVGKYFDATLKG